MSGNSGHRGRRALVAVAALLLGGVAGYLVRPHGEGEEAAAGVGRKSSGSRLVGVQEKGDFPVLAKTSRRDAGGISFSREQWAKIIEMPGAYRFRISDCVPDDMKRKTAGYLADRMRKKPEQDGPDLKWQMNLFGRDEEWADIVRKELLEFGKKLSEAEQSATVFEYLGDGTLRFDFSGSEGRKEELLVDLGKKLAGAIGERDAERLMALAGFGRMPSYGGNSYEIRVSPGPWKNRDGKLVMSEEGGGRYTAIPRMSLDAADPSFNLTIAGTETRVLHLEHSVDWLRLATEATERHPTGTE